MIKSRASEPRSFEGIAQALKALRGGSAPPSLLPAVLARVGVADRYARIDTPIGRVFLAYNRTGISAAMRAATAAGFERAFHARFGRHTYAAAKLPHPLARTVVRRMQGSPLLIPCHRVIRSDGGTGNYVFGPRTKRALLKTEGVDLAHLGRLARSGVHYVGSQTTRIFCYPACRRARRIAGPHRVLFRAAAEAAARGYRPCKICRPPRAA